MRTSIITAVTALCAVGLTAFVSAVSGNAQPGSPLRPAAAIQSPGAVCPSAAWPYAPAAGACGVADRDARPVRVIAVDAMPAGRALR